MESVIQKAITCPILVGRAPYMDVVRERLEGAARGSGATVLVGGEAGIGKSRLVREAAQEALGRGFLVLQGRCFETEQSLPFGPVVDLLHNLQISTQREAFGSILEAHAGDLSRLLPELAVLVSEQQPAGRVASPAPNLGPEGEKHRLISAVGSLFAQIASVRPLMVSFEDLHWSDDVSLELLLYIARRLPHERIFLMATYRSDEDHAGLLHTLAQLDRERLALEMRLAPLSPIELDTMLRAIFDLHRPVQLDFLNKIHNLTEGNPFFVEEMLKSLLSSGDVVYADLVRDRNTLNESFVPRTVQDAVQRRLRHLSDEARRMLALAAVLGRSFQFDLLLELLKFDEQRLLALIKECIRAQLVVEESRDCFAFRHALTRQAVYSGLLARERQALHGEVASALDRHHHAGSEGKIGTGLSDLAHHYYEARAWDRVHELGPQAGDEAMALYAPGSASPFYTMAIEAAAQLGVTAGPGLYRARGYAHMILGDFDSALADNVEALRLARSSSTPSPRAEWQSLLDLATLWTTRDYRETQRYAHLALELARRMNDPSTLAHTLNRVGNWWMNLYEPDRALRCHEEALSIFEALSEQGGTAETLGLLGYSHMFSLDLVKGAHYFSRAIQLCREIDDRLSLAYDLAGITLCAPSYATDTSAPADLTAQEALLQAEEALQIAREAGWRAGEAFANTVLSDCHITLGNYGQALSFAGACLQIAQEIGHEEWALVAHYCLGMTYMNMLATPQATEHLQEALSGARKIGSTNWLLTAGGDLALALVAAGDPARAEAILDSVMSDDTPLKAIGQRICWLARAEISHARGPHAGREALRIADKLISSAPNLSQSRTAPRLLKLRGDALALLGEFERAESDLRAAITAAEEQGLKPMLWRLNLSLGNLYRAKGKRAAALTCYDECRLLAGQLAESIPDQTLRDGFLAEVGALLPRTRPMSVARAAKEAFGGLTSREREVAVLVSRGFTNRQIGDQLYISEETAAVHVKNILSKLNFTSRAQIAAWVAEHSL